MQKNNLRVKGYTNLPLGYHLLERYDPIRRKRIFLISVLVWLSTGWLCILINRRIQSDYDWNILINGIITDDLHRLLIMGYGLLIVAVYGVIHEFIHAIFHWRFSHKWQTPRILKSSTLIKVELFPMLLVTGLPSSVLLDPKTP